MSTRILCVHKGGTELAIVQAFHRPGYEIVYAKDGGEALELMSKCQVDGVVLDSRLDAPQGKSLRFQMQHAHPGIPFLMYSNEDEVGSLPLSLFIAYLHDPGPPDGLLTRLAFN